MILYKCCGKKQKETEEIPERQNVFLIPLPDLPSHQPIVVPSYEPTVVLSMEPRELPSYEELKSEQFEESESPPSYSSLFPYKIYDITETL